MKKVVVLIFLMFLLAMNSLPQNEFKISFNLGYKDGYKPTYTPFIETETISLEKAKNLFNEIKTNSGIEFRYSYGGCEDRAHAISLLLKEKKISSRKVWNFDPYYISLYNSQEQPSIVDKTRLKDKVRWGFHVAVVLSVKEDNKNSLIVFDPAISDELLTVKKWLEYQSSPNSYYTFTDSQWFSFYTINGRNYNGKPMPDNFPNLLTGDFIKNEGQNLDDMWVEEGLAVNHIGMQIINEIVQNKNVPLDKQEAFKQLVTNIDSLTCFLKNSCKDEVSGKYPEDTLNYQTKFSNIRDSWKTRLNKIR